jgi:predicted amidophosphoribosyltransferase
MRRVKDIECDKCGQEFSASEHTQCPKCLKPEEKKITVFSSDFLVQSTKKFKWARLNRPS